MYHEGPFAFSVMSVMQQVQERSLRWPAYPIPRLEITVLSWPPTLSTPLVVLVHPLKLVNHLL